MREAEWQLDTDAYLQEQRWWTQGRLHCEFLCQQMFLHAAATGWSEHNCTICWGWREPSPKQDLGVEPTAMELATLDSMCQDIKNLYQDVYQLHRLSRRGQCKEAMEECPCKEDPWLHSGMPPAQVAICTARGAMEAVASWCPSAWSPYWVCCCKLQHIQDVCCHKMRLIWENDGHGEGCPPMGPGSSHNPWRKDGKNEPLHQQVMLQQPPMQEVQVLMMLSRSPGEFPLWGTWNQTWRSPGGCLPRRRDRCQLPPVVAPGDSTLKGHCLKVDPVT